MKQYLQRAAGKLNFRLVFPVQKLRAIKTTAEGPPPWGWLTPGEARRVFHYEQLLKTKDIPGSIVECGVASGVSLAFFSMLEHEFQSDRQIWGFDTFEGFPSTTYQDGKYLSEHPGTQQKYKRYSVSFVQKTLKDAGMSQENIEKIRLVKGLIPESFRRYSGEMVSILNIDVDLYEPTLSALNFFWPLMSSGGIIMLDEFDSVNDIRKWPGAKMAIDEFICENRIALKRHYTNRVFIRKD